MSVKHRELKTILSTSHNRLVALVVGLAFHDVANELPPL